MEVRKVKNSTISYAYGNVYTHGELWGTEEEWFTAIDKGQIEVIEDPENDWQPEWEEHPEEAERFNAEEE